MPRSSLYLLALLPTQKKKKKKKSYPEVVDLLQEHLIDNHNQNRGLKGLPHKLYIFKIDSDYCLSYGYGRT